MTELDAADGLLFEGAAWREVRGIWKPLYGGLASCGVSLEWHEFHLSDTLEWSKSFHDGVLEVCLNFGGAATFPHHPEEGQLQAGQIAVYSPQQAHRSADTLHRFFTVEVTPDYLDRHFSDVMDGIRPEVLRFMENPDGCDPVLYAQPLPSTLLPLRMHLCEPPSLPGAHPVWYQAKILEILAMTFFREQQPEELFRLQHKRQNRARVEHARYLLERDIEDPPSLELLASEVGCSVFHLSRIFSQECGVSIPRYLRQRRIEKAAEMLRSQKMSVTEVAMAVGYSSLSAFIKAFTEQHGTLPGQYLNQAGKPAGN